MRQRGPVQAGLTCPNSHTVGRKGVGMATVESYDCIATRVRARRASAGEVVNCSGVGPVLAEAGQWVVEVPEAGSKLLMSQGTFAVLFAPTEPESCP